MSFYEQIFESEIMLIWYFHKLLWLNDKFANQNHNETL